MTWLRLMGKKSFFRLQDPLYHSLKGWQVTMKEHVKMGRVASVRKCLLQNTTGPAFEKVKFI